MLDHVFISVSDIDRSIDFYEKALAPLGIVHAVDYDGRMALPAIRTSRGSARTAGCSSGSAKAWSRVAPRMSVSSPMARPQVDAAYAAAMAAGATEIHPPGAQLHYDPRYYAAQVLRSRRLQPRIRLQGMAALT
jgi:catechol 2,3-dioxygenase-like lactoylglutathione lyase family enzyme